MLGRIDLLTHAQRHVLCRSDVRLSYIEWGSEGEPLLLLHGLADHGLVWTRLAESLLGHYHSVAPDLRGHGESSKPERGYRCPDIIADLEALLAELNWTSAHVVAHSWAAKIALVWARQHPERFRRLILVDPFFVNPMPSWVKLTFPLLYQVLPFLRTMGPFASYEAVEQTARQLKQYRGWSVFQQAVLLAGVEQKPDGQWGSKFVLQARDEVFEDVIQVAGLTEPLAIPTLLITPEQGINRTEWQIQPFKRYLQNLQIASVPGNHWPFLVEPDTFNRTVESFLDHSLRCNS